MKIWREVWDYAKMIVVVLVSRGPCYQQCGADQCEDSVGIQLEKTIMTGDRIFGFRLAYGLNISLFGHEISEEV